ncbi:MAG TPA: hypothetical protein VF580_00930 [Thermoanaerobaculia bacterium]
MRIFFRVAAAGFFSMGATCPLWAASAGIVGHEPLGCVPARGNARIVATFKLPDSVISARVYFRRDGQASDYFLEMRRGDVDRYWALLPPPEDAGGAVVYRIVGRDGSGNLATTPSIKVAVSSACPVSLSEEEHRAARNIVLGLTVPGQNQNPIGFGCQGIVGQISPSGELRNVTPCSVVAGGKATGNASRDPAASSALTVTSAGMQSTTAAACGNPSGLSIGGREGGGEKTPTPPPPPPPPPPSPTPTEPPFSQSRPGPSPK